MTARVPDALDDEIAAVLGDGSLGVEVAPAGPGSSVLRVYQSSLAEAKDAVARARGVLAAHGLDDPDLRLAIDDVTDERWVERWQASLAPIPLGRRFVVSPGGLAAAQEGRETIRLTPGMAFGTGEHETTQMCAAAVEALVVPGARWLDLGTGTGLLAVVAARCGAARVLAVDLDPEAAAVAADVVSANGAASVVEVRAGSIGDLAGETFDGIAANIQVSFFLAHAAALVGALADGGVLVASGFLEDDAAEVAAALSAAGVGLQSRWMKRPWVCLAARRGGG